MLIFEGPQPQEKLCGRWERCIQKQPTFHFQNRHPDGYCDIPNTMELLEAPKPPSNQLPHESGTTAIGVEGKQWPPSPSLQTIIRKDRELVVLHVKPEVEWSQVQQPCPAYEIG
jgi:hypothetical protein